MSVNQLMPETVHKCQQKGTVVKQYSTTSSIYKSTLIKLQLTKLQSRASVYQLLIIRTRFIFTKHLNKLLSVIVAVR